MLGENVRALVRQLAEGQLIELEAHPPSLWPSLFLKS